MVWCLRGLGFYVTNVLNITAPPIIYKSLIYNAAISPFYTSLFQLIPQENSISSKNAVLPAKLCTDNKKRFPSTKKIKNKK